MGQDGGDGGNVGCNVWRFTADGASWSSNKSFRVGVGVRGDASTDKQTEGMTTKTAVGMECMAAQVGEEPDRGKAAS